MYNKTFKYKAVVGSPLLCKIPLVLLPFSHIDANQTVSTIMDLYRR
jgi:hypothetical protein